MNFVQDIVRTVRNLRAEARISPQQAIPRVVFSVHNADKLSLLKESETQIKLLTKVENIELSSESADKPERSLATVLDDIQVYLPVGDLLDVDKEVLRLKNDLAKLEKDIEKSRTKLSNENFVGRAPEEVIEKEKAALSDNEAKKERITENLRSLTA